MTIDVAHFHASGFLVLRDAFDPGSLAAEIDHVMRHGIIPPPDGGERRFRYVPMMTRETPVSLSLLDRFEAVAATLLGGPVLPTRAKGVEYRGDTPWHADSAFRIASIGVAAYLEPLDAESGALRVLPGSHREGSAAALPVHVITTEPGDVILFDERLHHASTGGGTRRQWRIDYLLDPRTTEAEAETRAYFESIYPPDWNGGYDVVRYPSYGPAFRDSGRPSVARLEALGVYALADAQERGCGPAAHQVHT